MILTPNHQFERSAKQQRCLVPVARCAPAPAQLNRWAFRVLDEGFNADGGAGRRIFALVMHPVLQRHSTGLEMDAAHRCHAKPSALRLATVEASMSCALVGTCDVASD